MKTGRVLISFLLMTILHLSDFPAFNSHALAWGEWSPPRWDPPTWEQPEWNMNDEQTVEEEEELKEWNRIQPEDDDMGGRFSFEQLIGNLGLDFLNKVNTIQKAVANEMINRFSMQTDLMLDVSQGMWDKGFKTIHALGYGLVNGLESARYTLTNGAIYLSQYGWGKSSQDESRSDKLRKANQTFHEAIRQKLATSKELGRLGGTQLTARVFDTFRNYNQKSADSVKSVLESGLDYFNVLLKSRLNAISNIVDTKPRYRPHGTLNDLDIDEGSLLTMAELSYYENENQKYEKSKLGVFDQSSLIGTGFNELVEYSKSGVSGFSSKTFYDEETNTIVVAFRGTEPESDKFRDYIADKQLVFGEAVKQVSEGKDVTRTVMKDYPDATIVLTGESLGGYIAQQVGQQYKIPTHTFNSPGVLALLPLDWNFSLFIDVNNRKSMYDDLIVNHVISKDEIGNLGIHIGKTIVYEPGGVAGYEVVDYKEAGKFKNKPILKFPRTIVDIMNNSPYHKASNFEEFLEDGKLRREE